MHPQETPEQDGQQSAQVTPISKALRPLEPPAGAPPSSVQSSPPSPPTGAAPPATTTEDPSKARRRLALGGGLLTGAAVLHGWLYHVGYLTTLDVPVDVFPQDVRSLLLNVYNVGGASAARPWSRSAPKPCIWPNSRASLVAPLA